MTDISDPIACLHPFDAAKEALSCYVYKLLRLVADLTDRNRSRGVTVKALIKGTDVYLYDIALIDDPFLVRYFEGYSYSF